MKKNFIVYDADDLNIEYFDTEAEAERFIKSLGSFIGFERLSILRNFLELASKPGWKYIEKGEFPKNSDQVNLCISFGLENIVICAEYIDNDFYRINTSTKVSSKIISWCELPKFNENE